MSCIVLFRLSLNNRSVWMHPLGGLTHCVVGNILSITQCIPPVSQTSGDKLYSTTATEDHYLFNGCDSSEYEMQVYPLNERACSMFFPLNARFILR